MVSRACRQRVVAHGRWSAVVAATWWALVCGPAHATPGPTDDDTLDEVFHEAKTPAEARPGGAPKDRANRLFQQGNELRRQGRSADALSRYQQAYRIYPSFKILLNMALTLEEVGRPVEAAAFFDRFIRRGEGQSPRDKMALARSKLAGIRARVASVWISCPVQGALVRVDSVRVGVTPLARWIYLAPGKHRLRLEATGFRPLERDLDLGAGQQHDLPLRLTAVQSSDGEPVVGGGGPARSVAARGAVDRRRQTRIAWARVLLGAGLAWAVGAGVMYGLGVHQGNAAHHRYMAAADETWTTCPAAIDGLYREKDAARTKLVVGHLFAGAALVSAGAALVLYLGRPKERSAGGPSSAVSLTMSASTVGAVAGLGGQF